jgi:hypothetical protein
VQRRVDRGVQRQGRPADRGGRQAQAEAVTGHLLGVDADQPGRIAVLDRGPQRPPERGLLHQQVERGESDDGQTEGDQFDHGDPRAEHLEALRAVTELDAPLGAREGVPEQALDDQRDREGEQHRHHGQRDRPQPGQQRPLEQHPGREEQRHRDDHREQRVDAQPAV